LGGGARAELISRSAGRASRLLPKILHDVVDQLQHVAGGELCAAGDGFAAELGRSCPTKIKKGTLFPLSRMS